jgi:hypothetical protein
MNLPEGYLLQILLEQFEPHIGADPIARASVISCNVIGRIQAAEASMIAGLLARSRTWVESSSLHTKVSAIPWSNGIGLRGVA